jgi:hypothetical protein
VSGYASRAEVVDVVRQTIATDHNGLGLPRDPGRFNLAAIVRECFYYSPGYGWHSTDADFCESLRANCRPLKAGTRVQFAAILGDLPVTLGGTVMPSRFREWARVQTDRGPVVELRASSLTVMSSISYR